MEVKPEDYEMPFGKFKGVRLYDIFVGRNDGPLYLDWLVDQPWLQGRAKTMIEAFLEIDWVSRMMQEIVDK